MLTPAADVRAALDDLGVDAATIEPLAWFGRAATYRVELTDGSRVKLRSARDGEDATRQLQARRAVLDARPDLRVTPVLGRAGRHLLEPWVDGTVLGDDPGTGALTAAARLLATLHAVPPAAPADPAAPDIGAVALERVDALAADGTLDGPRAGALRRSLRTLPAEPVAIVTGHGDLCGANLVEVAGDGLWSIDNEALGPLPLPLDLALAWYRWPVPPAGFARLLDAYAAAGGGPVPDLAGWCAAAVAKGLWFRSRHRPDLLPPALARLDDLLDGAVP